MPTMLQNLVPPRSYSNSKHSNGKGPTADVSLSEDDILIGVVMTEGTRLLLVESRGGLNVFLYA